MSIIDRIKDFLSPFTPQARRASIRRQRFMGISESDIPDAADRAVYEAVINAAMQGKESFAYRDDDGTVHIDGETYESPEAAREAVKRKVEGV